MRFTFDLPLPPSANALFTARTFIPKGGRSRVTGRGLTDGYKRWRDAAGLILQAAHVRAGRPTIAAKTAWGFEMRFNIDRRGDITNLVKACEDLVVKFGIVPDDCYMDDGRVIRDRTLAKSAQITVFSLD